jgi:hypothetical protein
MCFVFVFLKVTINISIVCHNKFAKSFVTIHYEPFSCNFSHLYYFKLSKNDSQSSSNFQNKAINDS